MTKGPWIVVYGFDFLGRKFVGSVRSMAFGESDLMGDYQGSIIADFTESHSQREHAYKEAGANAHAIAAVPELIGALLRISMDTHQKHIKDIADRALWEAGQLFDDQED